MPSRKEIIDKGFSLGKSVDGTNTVLGIYGYNPMGPREEGLYRSKTWGTTPVSRLKDDAKEFASGINTLMTSAVDYASNVAKDPYKALGNSMDKANSYMANRGAIGLLKDVGSLLGSPYGLTEQDIKSRGLNNVLYTLPGYAWSHPGYTTVDMALPLMGRLPKHQLGDFLERVNAPQIMRDFIPSTNVSKVNEAINSSKGIAGTTQRNMMRMLSEVADMKDVDMAQVARNLEAPKGSTYLGNEATVRATKKMKEIAKVYNKDLVDLGVEESIGRRLAQAQYVMEKVNPTRSSDLVVDDIMQFLSGKSKNIPGFTPESISTLANRAGTLYDQGVITPLSHRATFKADPRRPGLVTDVDKARGRFADRRYGLATPEELAPTLFKAYEDTAKEIYDANMGRLSVQNLVNKVGEKTTIERLKDARPLLDDEVLISPRAYNDMIKQDFRLGDWTTTNRRIKDLAEGGLPKDLREAYKDDLWVVKKSSLRPLTNMVDTRTSKSWLRKPVGTWKTSQLVTPKYVVENRLGNWALNFVEGVKLEDYLDAMNLKVGRDSLFEGKYHGIMPERLKADTSYYGVLGEDFRGTRAYEAFKKSFGTMGEGFKTKSPSKIYKGTFDLFSAPVLAFESQLESLDRYANFIRQAKRMAQETGESVENIVRRASKDNQLYDKLMGNVNRSLGDYVGRNWAINPKLYEGLSVAFPFFKYPTQAVRTLTHQAMSKPGSFVTKVTLPERIGRDIWNRQVAQYPELEDYEGGVVDHKQPGKYGYLHLHQFDVHPLGAGAGMIASGLSDWQNINISPFFSLSRIPNFLDRYGNTASSPKYYNAGGQTFVRDPRTGLPTRQLAEPDFGDRLAYAGSWYGNNMVPGVIAWNRAYGPLTASIKAGLTKKDVTWYPNYDTSILGQIGEGRVPSWLQPIYSGKTDRPGKKFPDTGLNQLGVRTLKVYPKQHASARSYQMALRKYRKNQMMKKYKEE